MTGSYFVKCESEANCSIALTSHFNLLEVNYYSNLLEVNSYSDLFEVHSPLLSLESRLTIHKYCYCRKETKRYVWTFTILNPAKFANVKKLWIFPITLVKSAWFLWDFVLNMFNLCFYWKTICYEHDYCYTITGTRL